MKVLKITFALLILTLLLVSGCTEQKSEPVVEKIIVEKKTPPEEKIKMIPEMDVYPEEVYGDPEIFSEPRLQFTWQAPGEEDATVWSTTLEGDDLRRVVAPELLFKHFRCFSYGVPLRSPDNRYLAVNMDSDKLGSAKMVYDLKEKTVKILGEGAGVPCFAWTPDSRKLYYYNDIKFWAFDVETNENTQQFPMLYSQGLYILNDGRFVTILRDGYSVYSKDRKEQFKKIFPDTFVSDFAHTVSPNGDLMSLQISADGKISDVVFEIFKPENIYFKSEYSIFLNPAFGPSNKKIYSTRGIVKTLDLKTSKTKYVFEMLEKPILKLTVINVKPPKRITRR